MVEYELPWTGEPLTGPFLSLDTETAVVDPTGREYDPSREIPPIVLATVSDGTRHAVLTPEQLPLFIRLHNDVLLVGHNIAFDYWVVLKLLEHGSRYEAKVWRENPEDNLLDDTMLLDFLVRLTQTGGMSDPGYHNLGEVAAMVGMEADKGSDYRLRFHELIGKDWSKVDRGFFDYAIQDTVVTWHAYKHLHEQAVAAARKAGVSDDLIEKYGPLTSKLQTRAAIVLAQVGRNGMQIDRGKVSFLTVHLKQEIDALVDDLDRYDPPLFDTYIEKKRAGQYKLNPQTGIPRMRYDNLRIHLERITHERGISRDYLPKTPKTRELATNLDTWRNLAGDHPFVRTWGRLMDLAKVLQFAVQFSDKSSVHPRFYPVVRTGRTSCRSPNLQQMPRDEGFREIFIPRPGHSFVIVDYSAIEIVTLAAVLEARFGKSVLADVLRSGRKPHEYTASLVIDMDYDEFCYEHKREKEIGEKHYFKDARQAAKAINFGVPGGLGARKLAVYAKTNYGVDMDEEQARELRNKLIREIYPELSRYLDDDNPFQVIAENLGCSVRDLDQLFETHTAQDRRLVSRLIDNVLGRGGKKADGKTRYPLSFRRSVWEGLASLNRNPVLGPLLASWQSGHAVRLGVTGQTVTTLTGRVRNGADYGEARNTPFQGLAADGAKVALWRLHTAGYQIVHYVHDEIVVEVPDGEAPVTLNDVSRIMQDSMFSVLQCNLPVEVEGVISKSWTK